MKAILHEAWSQSSWTQVRFRFPETSNTLTGYDSATGTFVAPKAGFYKIGVGLGFNNCNPNRGIWMLKTTINDVRSSDGETNTSSGYEYIESTHALNANDVVKIHQMGNTSLIPDLFNQGKLIIHFLGDLL